MKVIIAGSRTICNPFYVSLAIKNADFPISEVVCGLAHGVDLFGKLWAEVFHVPVKEFPADWTNLGKRAGYVRNTEMAEYADALIAIWDGKSKGTKHMIDIANQKALLTHIIIVGT